MWVLMPSSSLQVIGGIRPQAEIVSQNLVNHLHDGAHTVLKLHVMFYSMDTDSLPRDL